MGSLKQSYLRMKELIKDNRPPLSGHRLMTDFPKTQLDMFTYGEGTESSQEASLARLLPENSLERKYVVLDSILQYHMGEIRAWGGDWEIRQGPMEAPQWAKPAPWSEVLALELRTNPLGTPSYVPQSCTEQEVLKQIADGKRPDLTKIVGLFWAPGTAVAAGTEQTHLVRRVQSWDLPAMLTMLGQSWTFKDIYQVWCLMPLVVNPARRGKGEGIRQKKLTELTTHRQKTAEIKSFLSSVGLRFPQTQQEVRLLYKEIGSFLAASVFLARTPAIVLDLPEQVFRTPSKSGLLRSTDQMALGMFPRPFWQENLVAHHHRGQEQCTCRPPIPPYGSWRGLYHAREDQPLGNANLTVCQASPATAGNRGAEPRPCGPSGTHADRNATGTFARCTL